MNNLGITISFIIGGLLIVSILTLNGQVVQNSGETVLSMTSKNNIENITDFMRLDFQNMGYNVSDDAEQAIQHFSGNKITFLADIDNDKSSKATPITWEFTNTEFEKTTNPNDYELVRNGPIDGTIRTTRFPVVYKNGRNSSFTFLDKNQHVVSPGETPGTIRSVRVQVWIETPEKYGNSQYASSFWEKIYTPPNLTFKDVNW